jgi:hypothetical protein
MAGLFGFGWDMDFLKDKDAGQWSNAHKRPGCALAVNSIRMNRWVLTNSSSGKAESFPALPPDLPRLKIPGNGWGGFCLRRIIVFAILLASFPISLSSFSPVLDDKTVSEYEVKALYIYYFAKFVEWPADAFTAKKAPITIGIIGDRELGARLANIVKDKTIQEHSIVVHVLNWPADLPSCHIVYVSSSEQRRFAQIAEALQKQPVLTVTEAEESFQAKGVMNLFIAGGKVQFEVDLANAKKARLQISSKLIRLARGVTGKSPEKGE